MPDVIARASLAKSMRPRLCLLSKARCIYDIVPSHTSDSGQKGFICQIPRNDDSRDAHLLKRTRNVGHDEVEERVVAPINLKTTSVFFQVS